MKNAIPIRDGIPTKLMSVVCAEIFHRSVSTKLLKGGDISVRGSEMLYFWAHRNLCYLE